MALHNPSQDAAALHCRLVECFTNAGDLRILLDSLKGQPSIGVAFGEAVSRFIRPDMTKSSHIEARAAAIGAVGNDLIHFLLPLLSSTTNNEEVQWLASAVSHLATNTANRSLFGTAAVRDGLVSLAPRATTADSVQWLATAVSSITHDACNQALFGTAAVRDALVLMAPRATTSDSVQWLATAVTNIANNDDNQLLFLKTAGTFNLMAPYATTADSVLWFAKALNSISNVFMSKLLFCATIRDALTLMAPRATTADSVEWLAAAVESITSIAVYTELYCTDAVRDALVSMAHRATTAGSVQRLAKAVSNITSGCCSQALFGTAAVRDALVLMTPYATTADSVNSIATAVTHITIDARVHADSAANIFTELLGTDAVRDALVSMAPYAKTADSVKSIATAVSRVTRDARNQALFCRFAVRDALTLMAPYATTADSVEWIAAAVTNITNNASNKALFCTGAVRDALVSMAPRATTADSRDKLNTAITRITIDVGQLPAEWMERSDGYSEHPSATLTLTNVPSRENQIARNGKLSQYVDSVDVLVREVNRSVGEGTVLCAAFMGGNFAFAYVVMKDIATAQRIARKEMVHLLGQPCKAVLKHTVPTTSSLHEDSINRANKIELRLPWDGRVPPFVFSLGSVFARECRAVHDGLTRTATLQYACWSRCGVNEDDRKRAFVELNRLIGGALLHYAAFPMLNLVLGPTLDFDAAMSMYPSRTKLYLVVMWALLHVSGLGEVKLYGGCIRDGIVKGYLEEKGDIDVSYTNANCSIEAVIGAVSRVCETHRLPVSLAPNAKQKDKCHCAIARLTAGGDGGIAPTVDIEFTTQGDFTASAMDLSFNNFEISAAEGLTQKYPGIGGLLMHAIHDSIHKAGFIVNPDDSDYQRGRRRERLADGYHFANGDRNGGRLEGRAGTIPLAFDRSHGLHLHTKHRCDEDSRGGRNPDDQGTGGRCARK